jgi:hypothetical protein
VLNKPQNPKTPKPQSQSSIIIINKLMYQQEFTLIAQKDLIAQLSNDPMDRQLSTETQVSNMVTTTLFIKYV